MLKDIFPNFLSASLKIRVGSINYLIILPKKKQNNEVSIHGM